MCHAKDLHPLSAGEMAQVKCHQTSCGSPGTHGGLEVVHPHCCSEQASRCPPVHRPGSPWSFYLDELNAQHIFASHPTPAHLPSASTQQLSASLELVNQFNWKVWYLTHFRSCERWTSKVSPYFSQKNHILFLQQEKNLATNLLHVVVHWKYLLLTQAGVSSSDPCGCGLKIDTIPPAQHQIGACNCPGVLGILKGGPHGARNLKTTCLVPGIGLAPSHPLIWGLCLPACAITHPQYK